MNNKKRERLNRRKRKKQINLIEELLKFYQRLYVILCNYYTIKYAMEKNK